MAVDLTKQLIAVQHKIFRITTLFLELPQAVGVGARARCTETAQYSFNFREISQAGQGRR